VQCIPWKRSDHPTYGTDTSLLQWGKTVTTNETLPVEANDLRVAKWVLKLRPRICYVLSLLGIHSPDCEHCMARLTSGDELRRRLEELNKGNVTQDLLKSVRTPLDVELIASGPMVRAVTAPAVDAVKPWLTPPQRIQDSPDGVLGVAK
jgi:hypothetical protein